MIEVSIIIPVYNSSKYLSRCLDSILCQTFNDFELLLIDDGSTDDSGFLCDEYAAKDKRIRVFHISNHGQAFARNYALKQASGQWIHFVDSDDMEHPSALEFLYQAAKKFNADITVCDCLEQESVPFSFLEPQPFDAQCVKSSEETLFRFYSSGKYYWTVWGKLIKKSIIEKHLFTVGKYYEDNAVVPQWLFEADTIAIVEGRLYFYQINTDGTTKGQFSEKQLDYIWAMREQVDFYHRVGYPKMAREALRLYFGSYQDRMEKISSLTHYRRLSRKITRDTIQTWIKYAVRYPCIRSQWKMIVSVCCPGLLHFYQKIRRS